MVKKKVMKKVKKEKVVETDESVINEEGVVATNTAALKWTSAISVHESTIDNQHKKILSVIANIEKGLVGESEEKLKIIRDSIHFLYNYIKEHLAYEEE